MSDVVCYGLSFYITALQVTRNRSICLSRKLRRVSLREAQLHRRPFETPEKHHPGVDQLQSCSNVAVAYEVTAQRQKSSMRAGFIIDERSHANELL